MKKLIPTLCMLLVAASLFGTSTFAWFSMNRTVTATGMKVQATTSASLVIGQTTPVGTAISTAFTADTTVLTPATHDATVGTTTYLKYVTNPSEIDANTGVKSDTGANLTYADAVNVTGTNYYKDFVFYLAASGANDLANQTVTFAFDTNTKSALKAISLERDTANAFSFDIYVETVTDTSAALALANYKGTLVAATSATGVTVSGLTIPSNTKASYLRVTMRAYLDGALAATSATHEKAIAFDSNANYFTKSYGEDGTPTFTADATVTASNFATKAAAGLYVTKTGTNYVYTNSVDTASYSFGFSITAADPAT